MGRKKIPKVKSKLTAPVLSVGESSFRVTYPRRNWGVDDYIEITVRADASIDIRGFDGRLVVRPEVANKINVKLEDF